MNDPSRGFSGFLSELSGQDFLDRHWRKRVWFRDVDERLSQDCAALIGGTDLGVLVARSVVINAYREFKDIFQVRTPELALYMYRELGATLYMYLEKGDSARAYLERTVAGGPASTAGMRDPSNAASDAAQGHGASTALTKARHAIARALGCNTPYASTFAARASSVGTPLHCDNNENLTVQLRGTKRWRIASSPVVPHCVVAGEWDASRPLGGRALSEFDFEEVVMTPGAALYVPRGHLHEVTTVGDEETLSFNISVPVISWMDEIVAALSQAALGVEGLRRCPNTLDTALTAQAAAALEKVREILGDINAQQLVTRARRRLLIR
jgi:hypothetical protein